MPLVRVEVRNEYGLGMPELYTETDREDPKAVLDGVAVAGLVGILRQLGDLAEFAAEVFHGLQEQVLITSSRSHKLVERVHNIEAALPPLEKAILAQRSHLHFAYTAGSHWHTRIRTEQNHFIYGDLPRCIMDSYEDCRDPPRLHKLDKFDIAGPGACFRRYSDPTYFKRTSVGPYEAHLQSVPREKKARRNKKKRSSSRYRDVTRGAPVIMPAGITDFGSSNFEEKSSPVSQDVSTFHVPQKPEIEPEIDHLTSFDSRNGSGYIECIFRPSYSTQSEDNIAKEPSSDSNPQYNSHLDSDENIQNSSSKSKSKSTYITWDEKLEIIDSTSQPNDTTEIACETEKIDTEENEDMNLTIVDQVDFDFHGQQPESTLVNVGGHHDEIESETDYYMDALNTIESESETDPDCHTKRELIKCNNVNKNDLDDSSANFEFHVPVPEHAELATSPHVAEISEISPISLNTPENFKSEEAQRHVTNESIPSEPILTTRESPEPFLSTSAGQSQSQSQTTVSNPVMFWTNGGLLGLEPSKPPDFGLPTTVVEETKAENTSNENTGVNSSISESSGTLTPGGAESAPKDDHDPITSSQIFEFSNRLLVNGFRKQVSLVGNEKLASSVKTEIPEKTSLQNGYKTVTGIPFREQFGNIIKNENNKPLISPSSPPLEHMKISFQPIDGFEINKLKLTFPDENNNMFPSFQLVPECSISLHESGSDSDDDDDTFCRSSPYASDDLNSNQSESNSENWDSTRTKDHELDDAFGRISSAESVSSSNRIKFQQNDGLFDIPNFDPVNDIADPTPPPPPLPPVEWRGVKPPHDVTNEKEDDLSEALTFALNLTPQQPKPAPRKQEYVVEKDDLTLNLKNLHVHNESNRAINGKMEGEKEDFLQQIRTKSLNLRRTSTSRVTTTPVGPTSVKVTAILEKASAIRQAVGSDDGEDDTWSDT